MILNNGESAEICYWRIISFLLHVSKAERDPRKQKGSTDRLLDADSALGFFQTVWAHMLAALICSTVLRALISDVTLKL